MSLFFKFTGIEKLEKLTKQLEDIKTTYLTDRDIEKLNIQLQKIAKSHRNIMYVFDLFIQQGEELIENGEKKCGFAYFIAFEKYVENDCECVADTVTLYLRLAQYYLENNDTEKGINYLIKLCTETTSNYEESIEFRELTDIWERYKHLVAGKVPESVVTGSGISPIAPENCTMKISDILSLPQEELLTKFSSHLNEMSGNGTCLNYLNKWEKIVYDADLVLTEVNSDGFSGYLYYNGNRFPNAVKAFEEINSPKMLGLMTSVQNKFPSKKVPKSIESIQNKIDKMEEKDIDFEEEDEIFYNDAQNELLDKLYEFIMSNQKKFR
ncbi:MAG: DUF4375 domain-containing protein [Ruminococcaceae bacterium]|nr:DUF4375 domain-containing protein [Oscillospiraceae bacterium]